MNDIHISAVVKSRGLQHLLDLGRKRAVCSEVLRMSDIYEMMSHFRETEVKGVKGTSKKVVNIPNMTVYRCPLSGYY